MRFYKQTKRFLLLLAMLSAVSFADAQIKVEASETVELMSIISRTAGFPEYCMDNGGQYTSDTETWFSAYGQHPTVAYVKELRKNCANFTICFTSNGNSSVNTNVALPKYFSISPL